MSRIAIGAALLSATVLAGCASLSKNQCLAGDWQTVGYRDGLAGAQQTSLMRYQDACMKHGVNPDREAYLAGWRDGVSQYCQPGNAFRIGESGGGYGNVCPAHLQGDFNAAYQDGRRLYLAGAEVIRLHDLLQSHDNRVREIQAELTAIAASMFDPHYEPAERAAMVLTAKDLGEEKGRLESDMRSLRVELAAKEEELAHLRHQLAYAN
jgi:outer membrane murein-binding lipoprotein Lpp